MKNSGNHSAGTAGARVRAKAPARPASRIVGRRVFWATSLTSICAIAAGLALLIDALPPSADVNSGSSEIAETTASAAAPSLTDSTHSSASQQDPLPSLPPNSSASAHAAAADPTSNDTYIVPADDTFAAEHLADESGNYGFSVTSQQETRYSTVNENPDYPSLETRMLEMQARRGGKIFSPEAVLAALAEPNPWKAMETVAETLDLTTEQKLDGREFVEIDQLRIETLVPGDTIELPVAFENGSIRMTVDSVEVGEAGEVTWNGRIAEFETENQVSITQGKRVTAGEITTPNGNYMIESRAEAGWIVPATVLFAPEDEDDRIYPPHESKI